MAMAEANVAERALLASRGFTDLRLHEERVLVSAINIEEKAAARWDEIIDHRLIEWGKSQDEFQAEGLVGPTNEAIQRAIALVKYMRNRDWPLPTGVIPDGEGGIVFENRREPIYQRIEIDPLGKMWLVTFRNCAFESRVKVDVD